MKSVSKRGYTLTFDPLKHEYTVQTGDEPPRRVPSVTQVLNAVLAKPGLVEWAVRTALERVAQGILNGEPPETALEAARTAHRQAADKAATEGTNFHTAVETLLKGRNPPDHPALRAFQTFLQEHGLTPVLSEHLVYHPTLDYAGTVDLLALQKGTPVLLDLKVTRGIHPHHHLQLGGYSLALQTWEGLTPKKAYILHISHQTLTPHPVNLQQAEHAFTAALHLYQALREIRGE